MLIAAEGSVFADRLPNATPENQVFSIKTIIDVVGFVDDRSSMSWIITSPGSTPTGILGQSQSTAVVSYNDRLMTNGGHLSLNKNFGFDSGNQNNGQFNLESDKVLTYEGIGGSFLVGEEVATLDVAGNWSNDDSHIRCVFSGSSQDGIPAFCNIVKAKNTITNFNSGQISTQTQIRSVGASSDVSAALNQQIAVTPDANSGSGFADGTIATSYAGHILEARNVPTGTLPSNYNQYNKTASDYTWSDSTSVTGGIKNFQKVFSYESGITV